MILLYFLFNCQSILKIQKHIPWVKLSMSKLVGTEIWKELHFAGLTWNVQKNQ